MRVSQRVGGFYAVIALVTDVLLINRRANEGSEFPLPADVLTFLSSAGCRPQSCSGEFCQTAD